MQRDSFPLVFGVVVSTLLAGTLVIAGLKAGITPGVSPLVILFAWGAFTRRIAAGGGTRFLNISQVAGSAGMAVTAGVIFTAPLLQILDATRKGNQLLAEGVAIPVDNAGAPLIGHELLEICAERGMPVPGVEVTTLIILCIAGALIGFGFVGLGTKKFLTDPTLPAPEARACETMIEAAVAEPDKRPRLGRSLFLGTAISFLSPLLVRLALAKEHVVLWSKDVEGRKFQLDLPFAPIYIGIGGLLTLATALLVFGGSMLRLLGDYLLAGVDTTNPEMVAAWPGDSMRWVGGGAMTVAVAYSLVRFFGLKGAHGEGKDPLVEVDPGQKRFQVLSIFAGIGIMLVWLVLREGIGTFSLSLSAAILACCGLMVVLGAILSLQIGSSASPVSGTVFVTTLVLCLTAIALGRREMSDVILITPLLVGACVAVCTANDSSQDYKTMQFCGVRVQDGFLAQILGLLAGCIVVPIVLYISHEAYVLGSVNLNAPQGKLFATLFDGLLLSQDSPLPWGPITVGLAIGVAAVAMDVGGHLKGIQLPAMALAVGIYLPAYLGVGMLIGALCRFAAEGKNKQSNESILAAAGLITGAALLELILGGLIVGANSGVYSFDLADLELFPEPSKMITWVQNGLGIAGIAVLGWILFFNSKPRRDS